MTEKLTVEQVDRDAATQGSSMDRQARRYASQHIAGFRRGGYLLREFGDHLSAFAHRLASIVRPPAMTDDQIKHMVDRFLSWQLPANFAPDAGISFVPDFNVGTPYPMKHTPSGTNLFNAEQSEAMVRHMVEGLAALSTPQPVGEVNSASSLIAIGKVAQGLWVDHAATLLAAQMSSEDEADWIIKERTGAVSVNAALCAIAEALTQTAPLAQTGESALRSAAREFIEAYDNPDGPAFVKVNALRAALATPSPVVDRSAM